tara:strand:+ start:77 stop:955 length:879 start_codon:yes stop_codon:yes gene_type:complete
MQEMFDNSALSIGIAGVEIDFDKLELGHGIEVRKSFAHYMAPHMVSLESPTKEKLAPSPWLTVKGSFDLKISWEIYIPEDFSISGLNKSDLLGYIITMMRLGVSPQINCPVISTSSFFDKEQFYESDPVVVQFERNRLITFKGKSDVLSKSGFEWIAKDFIKKLNLISANPELKMALSAIDDIYFQKSTALSLVGIWGALEAIFTKSKAELRFRVSVMIASYLKQGSNNAYDYHKKLLKLYDARSKAAHGDLKLKDSTLYDSFEVMYEVIAKIFENEHVPTKEELERLLLRS